MNKHSLTSLFLIVVFVLASADQVLSAKTKHHKHHSISKRRNYLKRRNHILHVKSKAKSHRGLEVATKPATKSPKSVKKPAKHVKAPTKKASNTPKAAPTKADAQKGATSKAGNKPKTSPLKSNTQKKADDGKTPAKKQHKVSKDTHASVYRKSCEKPSAILGLYVDDIKTLIGSKTNMTKGSFCDGILRDPCCTNAVYDKIKSLWHAETSQKSQTNLMSTYTRNLNSIIYDKYFDVPRLAQFLLMKNDKIDAPNDTKVVAGYLAHKVFPPNYLRRLVDSGKTCWNHMANVIKGTYCKACDRAEQVKRFENKDKWAISMLDLHEYYRNCNKHTRNYLALLEFLDNTMKVLKWQ